MLNRYYYFKILESSFSMINQIDEIKNLLAKHSHITIVTHINPDADTLGTGLGIFTLLKKTKKVEIVNVSDDLPRYLDFLPSFSKIKKKMDYKNSLIIACDCGNPDRFGVNLEGREILNIDHHASNTSYGVINLVKANYASASQVAYTFLKALYPIEKEVAICFYTALLSDTRYFMTKATDKKVFEMAKELVDIGVEPSKISYHFTQRRSLASLRMLEKVLGTLTLYDEGQIGTLVATQEAIKQTGVLMSDMDGFVDYARSLATVEIGIFVTEIENGVRVSLRSKTINVSKIAVAFGGGGHILASGFTLQSCSVEKTLKNILVKIKSLGVLDEK